MWERKGEGDQPHATQHNIRQDIFDIPLFFCVYHAWAWWVSHSSLPLLQNTTLYCFVFINAVFYFRSLLLVLLLTSSSSPFSSPPFFTPLFQSSLLSPHFSFFLTSFDHSFFLFFFLSHFKKIFPSFLSRSLSSTHYAHVNSHPVLSSIPLPFLYLPAYPYLPRTLSISLYLVFLLHFHYTLSISLSFYTIPSSLAHSYHPPSHPIPLSIPSLPSLGTCSWLPVGSRSILLRRAGGREEGVLFILHVPRRADRTHQCQCRWALCERYVIVSHAS